MILEFKGSKFFYTRQGKGNAVVLLHGFLENQSMWEPFLPILIEKHTVITIDLPGHGKSECMGYVHTMELMAEVVQAVLLKETILQANFIGHSLGGYVVMAFAEKYPEKCSGIVLLNSTPEADSAERKENRDRTIALVKKHKNVFLSMAITNLFAKQNKERFATEIEALKKDALKMKTQGIIAALEGMKVRKNRTRLLKNFDKQKIIIAGSLDPIMPVAGLKTIAETTNSRLIILNGGHMSTMENSSEMLNIMHLNE